MGYFQFIRGHWRFLAFGMLINLFSSSGQTYFIAAFGGEIRAEFGLSHGGFGLVYGAATVASAACLIWLGRLIDRTDLRLYTVAVGIGIIAASLFISVAGSVVALGAAIFALRLTGQGLMTHISMTSMARYFGARRGTAISIASFGQTVGIASFPLLAVALIAGLGWRPSWMAVAAVYAVILIPAALWLLKGHGLRHRQYVERRAAAGAASGGDWKLGAVIRDRRFYLILPLFMAPSFIFTGFIFHQVHLVEVKGWSMPVFASGFLGLAAASIITSLVLGPLVDRIGAARMVPFVLAPLGVVLPLLAAFDHPAIGLAALIGFGINFGAAVTVFGAFWAEFYGPTHMGAIRALAQSLMVFASALSPAVFGWLLDFGMSIEAIFVLCLIYAAAASALALFPDLKSKPVLAGQ